MNPKILIAVILLGFVSALNAMYVLDEPETGVGLIAGVLFALFSPLMAAGIAIRFRTRRGQDNWT